MTLHDLTHSLGSVCRHTAVQFTQSYSKLSGCTMDWCISSYVIPLFVVKSCAVTHCWLHVWGIHRFIHSCCVHLHMACLRCCPDVALPLVAKAEYCKIFICNWSCVSLCSQFSSSLCRRLVWGRRTFSNSNSLVHPVCFCICDTLTHTLTATSSQSGSCVILHTHSLSLSRLCLSLALHSHLTSWLLSFLSPSVCV